MIVLLSFPGWMLPVVVIGWTLAIAALVATALVTALITARGQAFGGWLSGARSSRGRSALISIGVSCAAIAMVATAASAALPTRRPAVLEQARALTGATLVTTQTAVPTSRYFAATITFAHDEAVSVPVLVFGAAPDRRIEIGTSLRLSGSLIATAPSDEVAYLVFARGAAEVTAPPPWYLAWANGLRAGLAGAAKALPGDGGELLPGLAIGDTVAVSPQLSQNMKNSSLSHLTAVSGANCAVVIGLILLVGRALGFRRGLRIAVALVVLVGFVVLVTPQPSVLRSAIMAALVLGALARGRPVNGLPVVGVTVLAMLTLDPWLAVDYGFALSVLATAGLMALTSPIARRLENVVPRWLALLIAVPLAAQLACQPVLILLQPSLPLYGVLANSLAEPASPVATVVGLVACIVLPVFPPVGQVLTAIAWLPSAWIAAVADFFAALPGARLPWPAGFLGLGALAVATSLGLLTVFLRVGRSVRLALAGGALLLVGSMFALALAVPGIGAPPATTRAAGAPTAAIPEAASRSVVAVRLDHSIRDG